MKNDNKPANIPYATRGELVLAIALGCANIVIMAILSGFWKYELIFLALLMLAVYMAEIAVIGIRHTTNATVADVEDVHQLVMQKSSAFLRDTDRPIVLFNSFGIERLFIQE